MKLRSSLLAQLDVAGPFSISGEEHVSIMLYCIIDGSCLIAAEGEHPLRLGKGDIVMMPRWKPHRLCSDLSLEAVTIREAMRDHGQTLWNPSTPFGRYERTALGIDAGASPDLRMLTLMFNAAGAHQQMFIDCLPEILHAKAEDVGIESLLGTVQAFISAELVAEQPGFAATANRLAELLFIQLIRTVIERQPAGTTGWLCGLSHPQIAGSLGLMHREPGSNWSVERLAHAVGMSRSAFAAQFADVVGTPPMSYLRALRVRCAADFRAEGMALKQAAATLGYGSSYGLFRASAAEKALNGKRSRSH